MVGPHLGNASLANVVLPDRRVWFRAPLRFACGRRFTLRVARRNRHSMPNLLARRHRETIPVSSLSERRNASAEQDCLCPQCGYDLRESETRCPECGLSFRDFPNFDDE